MESSKVRKGVGILMKNHQWIDIRKFVSSLIALVLVCTLVGCGNSGGNPFASSTETSQTVARETIPVSQPGKGLSEVPPPLAIEQLSQRLEDYAPQVSIVSPSPDQVLQDTTVSVQLQVQDLPTFKDPELEMGPHLHVILDDRPYIAVYDTTQPLVLENLSAGTHTLRVFPVRPWHESFKNEGAYSQTTFHVFTKTPDYNPDPALPLLTYSRPTGTYGAEPIMLDFYLTNAPLHLVATENPDDNTADWRIRATVNGESFVLDRWLPIYLKGFKEGKNWVQLEFIDDMGNAIDNVFNNTARVFTYQPNGDDTLSKLVRGELSADAAGKIVDPNYKPTPTPTPEVTPTPTPVATPSSPVDETPTPKLDTSPETQEVDSETPQPSENQEVDSETSQHSETQEVDSEIPQPSITPSPDVLKPEETPSVKQETPPVSENSVNEESATSVTESVSPEDKPTKQPDNEGMFGRLYNKMFTVFQKSEVGNISAPEVPEAVEITEIQPTVVPEIPTSESPEIGTTRSQISPTEEVSPSQVETSSEPVKADAVTAPESAPTEEVSSSQGETSSEPVKADAVTSPESAPTEEVSPSQVETSSETETSEA
ncbi:MAG TPA: hypothetical protein DD000_21250 [Cyanobacteria bacterium UBA11166]|nr:hypothetical protein [Cyanobacteria bacterium UBA11166]